MCKWPNDLYYQDKKLAGILIELHGNNNQIHEAIIGIGLNVNMEASAIDIEKPWTSLKQILGTTQDRGFLAANIIQSLVIYLQRFATQGWKDFMSEWDKFDYLKGRQVSIPVEQTHVNGVATGIDSDGSLLVKTEDGKITPCLSGEVRV
jgi:BirA family biotin operon repressor/biotin-[acetyl-CoA-carboxylase] ligase